MTINQQQKKLDATCQNLRMLLRARYPAGSKWWVKTVSYQKRPTVMEVIGYEVGEHFSGVIFWRPARPGKYGCNIRAFRRTLSVEQIVGPFEADSKTTKPNK